ncbi:MAG: UDP-N-acetylmuramoylalanine--D-glutamate ligase, partial [Planctomycetes bacterium RIFOXYD12_FULL_42_12]
LDRHKTINNYIKAKKSIIYYQDKSDYAILNLDDKKIRQWSREIRGKTLYFSRHKHPCNGAFIHNNKIYTSSHGNKHIVSDISDIKLPGDFNQENILAALSVAMIFKIPPSKLASVIKTFSGVEHRLEFVTKINGVKYYNDSIATNPTSTIGAINTVSGNIHLILGGYDKQLPFNELAKVIMLNYQRVKSTVLIGATADKIKDALLKCGQRYIQGEIIILKAKSLTEAVFLLKRIAKAGDTILLSPACASFDMFRNFAERGMLFKKAVKSLKNK